VTSLQGKRTVIAALVTACVVVVAAGAVMSHVLSKNPPLAIAEQVRQGEPAVIAGSSVPVVPTGCWEVVPNSDTELSATWIPACTQVPPAKYGNQDWPQATLRLPALAAGQPPMDHAQPHLVLSEVTAQHGTGGLLYLPVSADGTGYYVAGWQTADESDEADAPAAGKRGIQIGLYGAPPTSVSTPGGWVYLSAEFSPRTWSSASKAEEPASAEDAHSADDENESTDGDSPGKADDAPAQSER
jgi:hypothetical protein